MFKKSFLVIMLMACSSAILLSQNFTFRLNGMGSINNFRNTGDVDYMPIAGYGAGFSFEERFNNWSFYAELAFQRKGGQLEVDQRNELVIDSKFIQAKLMPTYYFKNDLGENVSPFISFGCYVGPRIGNKEKLIVNGKEADLIEELTPIGFDLGLLAAIGYRFKGITISGRTSLGLINIADADTQENKFYHVEPFSLNVGFHLN